MDQSIFRTTFPEAIYSVSSYPTVFIDVPWVELLPEHRELLFKILTSIKLSPDKVRIVHQTKFDLSLWEERPSHLIAFILPPPGVALYELIETPETTMVVSERLEFLVTSEASKRKLWNALQTLFPA